jgi:hypothetical protein
LEEARRLHAAVAQPQKAAATARETIVARQGQITITVAPRCRRAEIATAQTIS